MESRVKQLETEVAILKHKYAELLKLTIEGDDMISKHMHELRELIDNNKFLQEEQLRRLEETYRLVTEL